MALHPEGVFTGGPLFQLVAVVCRDGEPPEREVARLRRVLGAAYWEEPWRAVLQPLASQADYLAVTFSEEFFAGCPEYARRAWLGAAGQLSVPGFLGELAGLLRASDRAGPAGYDTVPLARWEAVARFPLLRSLDTWAYDGEHDSFEAALRARIDGEHPCCDEELVPFVAQAQTALHLCAASSHFRERFLSFDESVTPRALRVVVDMGNAHLAAHHR
ncbi:hypothetical protein [Streptomyces sp. NPDC005805]|uniref:hypothetical protein n=1 Tax=Streptomyces sp. NPDC005805 TaxID=3157068 RepID=UPI003408B0A4